ncbi:Tn7-like transposition protein TnsC [Escherichia coli]|nr:Tn7-like transposition protein TnsC [Escherichia coli]
MIEQVMDHFPQIIEHSSYKEFFPASVSKLYG